MKRFFSLLLAALFLTACLSGCAQRREDREDGTLQVVSTIFASYDFLRELLTGVPAEITLLLPPGTEVHSYEPSARDVIRIQNCDLFVYVGGENEVWVEKILASLPEPIPTLRLLDCVDPVEEEPVGEHAHAHDHEEGDGGEWDEHVWTSPVNAVEIVQALAEELCRIDDSHARQIRLNSEDYQQKLWQLDERIRTIVAAAKNHILIFADRFPARYFVEEYGLHYYAAFPGCSADTEPSAATVAALQDKILELSVPAIFHTELSSEELCNTLCADTGVQKLLFHSCHNISLKEYQEGATYLSLMEQNARAIEFALN